MENRKPKGKTNILTNLLQGAGWRPQDFAREVLGLNYSTYTYRVRKGQLRINDYQRILGALGKTWEEVFGSVEVIARPVPKKAEEVKGQTKREPNAVPFVADEIDFTILE